jgi:hypothetical protein
MAATDDDIVAKLSELQEELRKQFERRVPGVNGDKYQLALETTQKSIMTAIFKLAKIKEGDYKTHTENTVKLSKAIDDNIDSIQEETTVREQAVKAAEEEQKRVTRAQKPFSAAIDALKQKLKDLPGAFARFKVEDEYNRTRQQALGRINEVMQGNIQGVVGDLTKMLGGATFGAVIDQVIKSISNTIDTYRELNAVGQGFGGSLLNLQIAAADAGLPMKIFADAIKKNSVAVAALGGAEGFGRMYKNVRENIRGMAQYGLTLEEGANYLGDYLETERLTGGLRSKSDMDLTRGFTDLLDEVDKTSKATGVQRSVIMEQVLTYKRNPQVFGIINSYPQAVAREMEESLTKIAVGFAGVPGEIGKELTEAVTTGLPLGSTIFSNLGKSLNVFGGQLRMGLDNVLAATKAGGDVEGAMRQFGSTALAMSHDARYMRQLSLQASIGNEDALKTLQVIQAYAAQEDSRRRNEARGRGYSEATKALLNFQSVMQNAVGTIKEGFLTGFAPFADRFNQWLGTDGKNLTAWFTTFGERLGKFVGETLTPKMLSDLANGFAVALSGLTKFSQAILFVGGAAIDLIDKIKKFVAIFTGEEGANWIVGIGLTMAFLWRKFLGGALLELFSTVLIKPLVAILTGQALKTGAVAAAEAAGGAITGGTAAAGGALAAGATAGAITAGVAGLVATGVGAWQQASHDQQMRMAGFDPVWSGPAGDSGLISTVWDPKDEAKLEEMKKKGQIQGYATPANAPTATTPSMSGSDTFGLPTRSGPFKGEMELNDAKLAALRAQGTLAAPNTDLKEQHEEHMDKVDDQTDELKKIRMAIQSLANQYP